jgi:hypothetical protein
LGPEAHEHLHVTDLRANSIFAFEAKSTGPLDYQASSSCSPRTAARASLQRQRQAQASGASCSHPCWRPPQGDRKEELATLKRILEG